MYQDSKRTNIIIVLLINFLYWPVIEQKYREVSGDFVLSPLD